MIRNTLTWLSDQLLLGFCPTFPLFTEETREAERTYDEQHQGKELARVDGQLVFGLHYLFGVLLYFLLTYPLILKGAKAFGWLRPASGDATVQSVTWLAAGVALLLPLVAIQLQQWMSKK